MRNLLQKKYLFLLLCFTSSMLYGQDAIMKIDGEEISAKVHELTDTHIKYKRHDHLTGPIHNIQRSDVFMIIYENGSKEVISAAVSAPEIQRQQLTKSTVELNREERIRKNEEAENGVRRGSQEKITESRTSRIHENPVQPIGLKNRSNWSFGVGVLNGWNSGATSSTPPIVLTIEKGINENMSWGIGGHYGHVAYNFGFGGEFEFDHFSIFGKYYYHFLPRDSKFDLAGVGTLGYGFVSISGSDFAGSSTAGGGFGLGIAGLGRLRLGKKFSIFSELGWNRLTGYLQAGIAFGRM